MSKRAIGIILVIIGALSFHLLGFQPETKASWTNEIPYRVYSNPVTVKNNAVFVAGEKAHKKYKLIQVDLNGKTTESIELPILPFQPIAFSETVLLADKSRMLRGFAVPGLKLMWEVGTIEPLTFAPLKIDSEKFVVTSTSDMLFCIDSKTGKPLWEKKFHGKIMSYAADKVVVVVYGYADVKSPIWKMMALEPETGDEVWEISDPVSSSPPFFKQNVCIQTTNEGQVMIINQFNGEIIYKHPIKGLKIADVLDEKLVLLAAGGSRVICMSLMTGNSWTTTLQTSFQGVGKTGNRLLLVDKKNLRCVDSDSGELMWHRPLEDVYNVFQFRNGVFVTHKDSFFDRTTYGSYIDGTSGQSQWTAFGKSIFYKPTILSTGDFLVSYNGMIKLMPKPKTSIPAPSNNPNDPAKKINFWKDPVKSASSTKKLPPKDEPEISDPVDLKDTGWK